jgi:amino acid transporter
MFFKGFPIFCYKVTAKKGTTPVFDWRTFITTYLGIPLYVCMFVGYKLVMRTSVIKPGEADMYSGKARIDREEAEYLAQEAAKKGGPETTGEKIYRLTLGWLF